MLDWCCDARLLLASCWIAVVWVGRLLMRDCNQSLIAESKKFKLRDFARCFFCFLGFHWSYVIPVMRYPSILFTSPPFHSVYLPPFHSVYFPPFHSVYLPHLPYCLSPPHPSPFSHSPLPPSFPSTLHRWKKTVGQGQLLFRSFIRLWPIFGDSVTIFRPL